MNVQSRTTGSKRPKANSPFESSTFTDYMVGIITVAAIRMIVLSLVAFEFTRLLGPFRETYAPAVLLPLLVYFAMEFGLIYLKTKRVRQSLKIRLRRRSSEARRTGTRAESGIEGLSIQEIHALQKTLKDIQSK